MNDQNKETSNQKHRIYSLLHTGDGASQQLAWQLFQSCGLGDSIDFARTYLQTIFHKGNYGWRTFRPHTPAHDTEGKYSGEIRHWRLHFSLPQPPQQNENIVVYEDRSFYASLQLTKIPDYEQLLGLEAVHRPGVLPFLLHTADYSIKENTPTMTVLRLRIGFYGRDRKDLILPPDTPAEVVANLVVTSFVEILFDELIDYKTPSQIGKAKIDAGLEGRKQCVTAILTGNMLRGAWG